MGGRTAAEEFVLGFARQVVAEVAPDELIVFEPVSLAFLRDPRGVLGARVRPDAELGSGIDTVVLVVTPVAMSVATVVYEHLLGKATEMSGRQLSRMVTRLRKRTDPVPAGAISAEVREATVAQVLRLVGEQTDDPQLAEQCARVVGVLLEGRR